MSFEGRFDRMIEIAERMQHDPWFKERLLVLKGWKAEQERYFAEQRN